MMTEAEQRINMAATFLPMEPPAVIETDPVTGGPAPYDPDGGTLPCIEVGGVQVYAYFSDGVLHVSTHYDTADPEVLTEDDTVPTEVNVGGTVVWRG